MLKSKTTQVSNREVKASAFTAYFSEPEEFLKLSDSYLEKDSVPMLELVVKVININLSNKHEILNQCRPLYEYSWFIQRIKEYQSQGMTRDNAITRAIRDCKKEDIMADFMYKHGSEVANMLFGEYDEKLAKEVAYEEGFEDGELKGRREGHSEKLIQLVLRKARKGKVTEIIAEELEEPIEIVEKIYAAVQESGTDADVEEIYEIIQRAGQIPEI